MGEEASTEWYLMISCDAHAGAQPDMYAST
jgi:hypothetical protein